MEELKNIVIQTLESNGILGNLRAQLRASVFKVIDSQDKNLKDGCGFQWENPLAPKIIETAEGMMWIDLIREFLEFYRMDYTLSTFLPECSLSQEPKTRTEMEEKIGLPQWNTSMPLLMHLILWFQKGVTNNKNASPGVPKTNNFVEESEPKGDLLWEKNKNMDIKPHLENKENTGNKKPMASLTDLPPLTQKKGGLQPLDFNPKEEDKFDDSVEKEKKKLTEVDKKLKEFEAPKTIEIKNQKPKDDEYEDDDFEDDIAEDLPVEDIDAEYGKEKDQFAESGVSQSQSMGMDPSVTSLDIEGYDYVEQAVINSPYKI